MSKKGYTKLLDSQDNYNGYSTQDGDKDKRKQRHRSHSNETESNILIEDRAKQLGQMQNTKSKKVYVFSDGTIADTEDETVELTQMTRRGTALPGDSQSQRSYKTMASSQFDDIITKEIPLHKTDTLQSLSIKFRCPIPELKRINKLYNDQEFYALTSIKIPIRSHQRLLQQELETVAKSRLASGEDVIVTKKRCTADIVSSETSEDEEMGAGLTAASNQSVLDMIELHSDPEDSESYALLDRDWSNHKQQTANDSKREKKKFDKIISRKDEELKVISEKVQQQTNGSRDMAAFMTDASLITTISQRPRNCLSTINLSVPCLLGSLAFLVIIVPILFVLIYHKFFKSEHS